VSARQMRRAWKRSTEREARIAERTRRKKLIGAAGAAIGATVLFAPAAQAADFTVTTLDDTNDGTCDTDCSLREAVYDANDANGDDVVLFDSQLSGTIHLQYGDIEIYDGQASDDNGGLDIQGPGPGVITVDGEYQNRIFDVGGFYNAATPVRIGGLKMRAGDAERDGGAIRNWSGNGGFPASLTVDNSVIADNYAEDDGGGIFHEEQSLRTLTITDTRIVDNRAGAYGGGVSTNGSTVTITGSQINDNVADTLGGGLFVKYAESESETEPAVQILDSEINNNRVLGLYEYQGPPPVAFGGGAFFGEVFGEVVIERSTIAYNEADPNEQAEEAGGGGIFAGAVLATSISGSTIANNTASKYGGGLAFIEGPFVGVQNTTISGNEAGETGGGVVLGPGAKYATFQNSTITDNDAWHEANGSSGYGGGIYAVGSDSETDDQEITLSSTIVAENNDRYDDSPDLADNINAVFLLDHSLIGDIGGANFTDNGNNQIGNYNETPPIDPLIAPLSDNGGPTETHLPLAGSPVLDAGISNDLTVDQRGEPRTFDLTDIPNVADGTDIGSVEVQGPPPAEEPGATGECNGGQVPLISGTDGPDELSGTPGPDLIRGGGARDDIDGREGDDCLFGEADGDVLNGDSGDDLVSGDDGDDILSGVQGADNVLGGAGDDRVKGNAGDDTVAGGSENDVLAGGGGADKVRGNEGDDTVRGAEASDKVSGGAGEDKLKGAGGDDKLKGGAGADRINCGAGDDVAKAGPGDTVSKNCETVK
jgi:CSLREA domain-containing protein